jgi:hypothetical protein
MNKKGTNEQSMITLSSSSFILEMKPLAYWSFDEVLWMADKLCMEQTVFISKLILCGGLIEMASITGEKKETRQPFQSAWLHNYAFHIVNTCNPIF